MSATAIRVSPGLPSRSCPLLQQQQERDRDQEFAWNHYAIRLTISNTISR